MEIGEYMNKDVITCTEGETVTAGVKRMAGKDVGSLVVVKAGSPCGIFTERDLVKRVIALGKDPDKVSIGEVMTRKLITVTAEDTVGAVYHLLVKSNVRHLPVLEKGHLAGIVSQKDIARVMDLRFYSMYFGKRDLSGDY
jgi:CBS domain-containing protein